MLMSEDPDGSFLRLLGEVGGEPEGVAQDPDGTIHRLWVVRDLETAALPEAIGAGPLYIADGHHRFETAVAYRDEMRRAHPQALPEAGFNYGLACFGEQRQG